jgi:hypothetical protein
VQLHVLLAVLRGKQKALTAGAQLHTCPHEI